MVAAKYEISRGRPMPIRILIVDNCHVIRQGLRAFLQNDPEIEIVGEARDGKEALYKARQVQPDIVLVDLTLPVMDGITFIKILQRELPETKMLIFTGTVDNDLATEVLRTGVSGYVLKNANEHELRNTVKETAAGLVRLSQPVTRFAQEIHTPLKSYDLTTRELDVLQLLVEGCSNLTIAGTLHITEHTVKTHVHHILTKLRVKSRTQAVLAAVRLGLVSQPQKLLLDQIK